MNRKTSTIGVTALILGLTLLHGIAWAGSVEIPIAGTQVATTIDAGVQWTDDDGITHYRGLVQTAVIAGQDLDGIPVTGTAYYVMNINIDMATGNGDMNIEGSYEMTYGDLTGNWLGRSTGTITGFVIDGRLNYPRGFGDFDGWHLRGTWTAFFAGSDTQWDAIFHIPGGGGGNKAAATDSETWSGVKDLFR